MGSFNDDLFKKSFEFVQDLQQKERKELDKAVEKEKDPRRKASMQLMSQRLVFYTAECNDSN